MASISPHDEAAQAALRNEQYQEHQLRLQEKYRLQHQHQMGLQTATHPHDPVSGEGYFTAQGHYIEPKGSPCYDATPQYGLADFELHETLGKHSWRDFFLFVDGASSSSPNTHTHTLCSIHHLFIGHCTQSERPYVSAIIVFLHSQSPLVFFTEVTLFHVQRRHQAANKRGTFEREKSS